MMKRLKVRVSSIEKFRLLITLIVVALAISLLPLLLSIEAPNWFSHKLMDTISMCGILLLLSLITIGYLFSRFSPSKLLRLRKKLILFTEQLTKQTQDGGLKYSVEWGYSVTPKQILVDLYSGGLIADKKRLSVQLAEFLRENLLSYEEKDNRVRLTFGEFPQRLNGMEVLFNDRL